MQTLANKCLNALLTGQGKNATRIWGNIQDLVEEVQERGGEIRRGRDG